MLLSQVNIDQFLWSDGILPILIIALPCLAASVICYLLRSKARKRSVYAHWMLIGTISWMYAGLFWLLLLILDLRLMGGLSSPVTTVLDWVCRYGLRPMLVLLAIWIVGLPFVLWMRRREREMTTTESEKN